MNTFTEQGILTQKTLPLLSAMFQTFSDGLAERNNASELVSDHTNYRNENLHRWYDRLRPNQRPPAIDWLIWMIQAGRGYGKTLAGACETIRQSESCPQLAIVAPTFGDGRDYCIEGESGIKAILGSDLHWNRSMGEMTFPSGAKGKLFSAEEPDRLRGPNNYFAWCDEFGSWKYQKAAWDMLMFTMRKGAAQTMITHTPKPSALLKELKKRPTTVVVYGSSRENIENLSPAYIENIIKPYEGTRLGRQEIDAEDLEDAEGALWKREQLDRDRVTSFPDLIRIVVSIDPATTSEEGSNQTGLCVSGLAANGHGYGLEAKGLRVIPNDWAREAVALYYKYKADLIIGEANNGGDMIEALIRAVDPNVNYKKVHASRGKVTRAEPVAALYERGMVHHVGALPELEDQYCTWERGMESPDLLDAAVWGFTELMLPDEPEQDKTVNYMPFNPFYGRRG